MSKYYRVKRYRGECGYDPISVVGDIWTIYDDIVRENRREVIVIPTNALVDHHGNAIMGAGIAKQAKEKIPGLSSELGLRTLLRGNLLRYFPRYYVVTFPTKHNWWDMAEMRLIKRSCYSLNQCMVNNFIERAYLPRVGCGNGGLKWEDVKPVVYRILDKRCTIVHYRKEE